MRVLLDTHVFLWFIAGSPKLSLSYREAIEDAGNDVYLSVVSVWEIAIKQSVGELRLPEPTPQYIAAQRERHRIASLPLEEKAAGRLAQLAPVHRDPFDRMLACQAIENDMSLATVDPIFSAYEVSLLPQPKNRDNP